MYETVNIFLMNGERKIQLTTGNWITIAFFLITGITAWAKIEMHVADDAIHLNKGEVTLTTEEYKNLLNFATTVQNKFGTIETNEGRIIELEKGDAVHFSEFNSLFKEHDDLETKVSRVNKELLQQINLKHD